ncbi:MAG TPA: hypothetical protein VFC84_16455 [Desulfosporosinus sp.]|nr:hypothetical protein [Desulfosporosinus sp.]
MTNSNSLKSLTYSEVEYNPLVDSVMTETGDSSFPIWLLVNPKYPADRRDIWAPIVYEIQDQVYRKLRKRIDTKRIFIKNAVSDIGMVSNTTNCWATEATKESVELRESVLKHQPKMLITFGAITYEYVKRVFDSTPDKKSEYWSATNLGDEFERSIASFDINQTNNIPLPRRFMKRGKHTEERNHWSREDGENYFRDLGSKIADRIIENEDSLNIWIE